MRPGAYAVSMNSRVDSDLKAAITSYLNNNFTPSFLIEKVLQNALTFESAK